MSKANGAGPATPLAAARAEVARLEGLRSDWEQRRADAQAQSAAIDAGAGAQVLAGQAPEMVAMDLAGARAGVEVADRTLAAIGDQLIIARRRVAAERAAELRAELAAKRAELRQHGQQVATLLEQLRELDQVDYQPVMSVLGKGAVWADGVGPAWRMPKTRALELECLSLEQQAQALEREAGA